MTSRRGYEGLSQHSRQSWRRPWERLPAPVQHAGLRAWGLLPSPVRRLLGPLGDVINPGHTVSTQPTPGPSVVPGVDALRAEGFTPIEEMTGYLEVASVWPEQHRRSVAETREWWLEDKPDGRVWLVRPPWPSWSLDDVLRVLWSVVDGHRDSTARLNAASDVLRWPESRAAEQLAALRARDQDVVRPSGRGR